MGVGCTTLVRCHASLDTHTHARTHAHAHTHSRDRQTDRERHGPALTLLCACVRAQRNHGK